MRQTFFISVRATRVTDNGNGTFDLEMEGAQLTVEDRKILEQLFPNLTDKAYELLNKEALLNAIATPAERESSTRPNYPDMAETDPRPMKPKK
jgi:hypothetical protein